MKRLFFIIILLFGSATGVFAAEHILQGRIVDSATSSGVGYATVVLTDARGKGVSAVAADKEGAFSLRYNKDGIFKLTISAVGYSTNEKEIKLNRNDKQLDFGNITLQAGVEIEGITIKPLVVEKEDRIIYNVKADPEAKYRKMSTIMVKVPGLDNSGYRGTFRYNRRHIQDIYINGKHETLISKLRQYTMDFIGAAVMDEIEVIMPHSAEYGNTGVIINIKTNQPLPIGFASELGGDATPREGRYSADIDAAVKPSRRLSFGVKYKYSLTHSPTLHKDSRSEYLGAEGGAPLYTQYNNAADSTRGQTHTIGLDNHGSWVNKGDYSIKFQSSFADQNRYSHSASWRTDATTGAISNNQLSNSRSNSASPLNLTGNLEIGLPIQTQKSSIRFRADYTHNESTTDSWVNSDYAGNSTLVTHSSSSTQQDLVNARLQTSFIISDNPQRNPYPHITVAATYSWRRYDNASLYESSQNGGNFVQNPNDGLFYNQNIMGAEIRSGFKPKSKMLGAIRLSATLYYDHTKGVYRNTGDTPLDYSKLNWSTSGNFSIDKGPLPFSLRLTTHPMQPSFSLLNPYVDNNNPMHLRYGNPNLRPEMNYSANVSFKSRNFISKLTPRWMSIGMPTYQFTYIDNSINPITEMREDGVTVSTYDNFGNELRHEVRGGIDIRPFKRANIGLDGTFTSATYNISEGYSNTINTFSWSTSASYRFRKNKWLDNTQVSASYSARPTATMAQAVEYGYYHTLGISFSTDIPKIKAGLAVKVSDILHGHEFVESTLRSGTFIRHSSNEVLGRSINLSAYIRFGKFRRAQGEVDAPESSLKSF